MNITVVREKMSPDHSSRIGGECAVANLEILIDKKLPIRTKRELVIHAVIENYFRSICHDKVDEITSLIVDGLDQIKL